MKDCFAGAIGLAALAVIASAAIDVRPANALPAYSQKEGKPCGYCHVNAAGGGERNAKGKKYEAAGHSFK